jgi:hypothetical protein
MKWRSESGEMSPMAALMMFWGGVLILEVVFIAGVLGQLFGG